MHLNADKMMLKPHQVLLNPHNVQLNAGKMALKPHKMLVSDGMEKLTYKLTLTTKVSISNLFFTENIFTVNYLNYLQKKTKTKQTKQTKTKQKNKQKKQTNK